MTVGQKASLSLLVAVLLFAAFAVAAFSGFFNFLEARFYDPAISRQYNDNLSSIAKAAEVWNALNFSRFSAIIDSQPVKRSFLPNISAQDSFDRANSLGKLQADTPGLVGIRLIDLDGKRIHFSSFLADILKKNDTSTLFRDYGTPDDLPFSRLEVPDGSKGILRVDETSGRLYYALPVVDESAVRRGMAVFYLSPAGLLDNLVRAGLVQVGDSVIPAGSAGLLFRAPLAAEDSLAARVAEAWSQGLGASPLTLAEKSSASAWTLLSASMPGGFRLGLLLPAATFVLPLTIKVILLVAFFLTAYLLLFLLLNLRQEKSTIVAERIKRYQIGMLEASFDEKVDRDLARFKRRLESRRSEFHEGIKADLGRLAPKEEAEADALIEKSWDEIIAVLDRRVADQDRLGTSSLKEIERLIKEALGKASFVLPASALPPPAIAQPPATLIRPSDAAKSSKPRQSPPSIRTVSPPATAGLSASSETELEEAAAVEELEEAEAVEELEEAEAVEELEEAEVVEELEEAEAVEELEEAEVVEELEEAEAVEELEEAEVVEELEEAEAVEELEEAEAAKELEEPEAVEEPEEAEAVEELEEAEVVEELEEAEAVEELEEPEALEEFEEAEAAKELEEPEAVEEPEEAEAVEEPEEAEVAEDLEVLEAVDGEEPHRRYVSMVIDDDLIPVIPEDSILELVDSTDIGELMSFLDLGAGESRPLDLLELGEEGLIEAEDEKAETASDQVDAELLDLAEDLSEEAPTELEELDVFFGSPEPPSSTSKDGAETPSIKLSLSSIDLSSLSEIDSLLDELGNLMAMEVGAALPAAESLVLRHEAGLLEGAAVEDYPAEAELLDVNEDVDEELPMELLPAQEAFRSLGVNLGHLGDVWAASRPVEGFLPLADDGVDELEPMEEEGPAEPAGLGPIRLRDGIYRIEVGEQRGATLDPDLKYLVDSVLGGNPRRGRAKQPAGLV